MESSSWEVYALQCLCTCLAHLTLSSFHFIANYTRARLVFLPLYLACLLNKKQYEHVTAPISCVCPLTNPLMPLDLAQSPRGAVARTSHDSKVGCHTTLIERETQAFGFQI